MHDHRTDWRKREASQVPCRVSEPVFVEAEMGCALRVAGRRWAVSRWPKEPCLKARVIKYAPSSVSPRASLALIILFPPLPIPML